MLFAATGWRTMSTTNPFPKGLSMHACTVYTMDTGAEAVIVAGGYTDIDQ
jgi:hypothetical protein